MDSRDKVRLRHMIDAAQKAIAFVQGRQRADLDTDEILALAVVRLVQILGKGQKTKGKKEKEKTSPDLDQLSLL